jgi:CxxC motif-containing protein
MRSITVEAPVKEGDVIAEDIAGTGIDVIAARSL